MGPTGSRLEAASGRDPVGPIELYSFGASHDTQMKTAIGLVEISPTVPYHALRHPLHILFFI